VSARGCIEGVQRFAIDQSYGNLDQACQTHRMPLYMPNFIAVFGLPSEPGAIHTCLPPEIQHPAFALWFFAADVRGIKGLRSGAIFALEIQQSLFERVNVHEYVSEIHASPPWSTGSLSVD
jgi:hypothetical protein